MSSDILSIIAREPARPRFVRPTSPEVHRLIEAHKATEAPAPSPPASPPPVFRVHGDVMSQIGFDDSASQVGARTQPAAADRPPVVRAASPDSLLLNAMRNEQLAGDSPARSTVSQPAPDEVPPRHFGSPQQDPDNGRYQVMDYSGDHVVPATDTRPQVTVGGFALGANGQARRLPLAPNTAAGPSAGHFNAPVAQPQDMPGGGPAYYQQPEQAQYPPEQQGPSVNYHELRAEKEKLLAELHLKRAKGYDVPGHLDLNTDLEDLKSHAALIRRLENHKRTIALLRYFMVLACTGIEKATMRFMTEVYMDGWAETIAANQNDYDDVLGRIAETMDLATTIPPHIELVTMLAVSAVMFHMSKKSQKVLEGMMEAEAKRKLAPPPPPNPPRQRAPAQPTHAQQLTEEQLRIHNLITGGQPIPSEIGFNFGNPHQQQQQPPRDYDRDRDRDREVDRDSMYSDRSATRTRKRAKIQVDADDIVRLFD